jgi:Ca2+-binding RTX toxin-like protein
MAELNLSDLQFILTQIKLAESGQPPVNALLSFGLRTVDGTDNSVVPGQDTFGAVDQTFLQATDPLLLAAQSGTTYAQTSGLVIDSQPRIISNLIADQTADNPAAVAAQQQSLDQFGTGYLNTTTAGPDGIFGTADDVVGGNLATPTDASSSGATIPGLAQSLFINNVTPDAGLSAPFSSWFTFFGQFFDHGLDLITKSATSGTVFMPLLADDPLYDKGKDGVVGTNPTTGINDDGLGADGLRGTADDRPNFMVLTRAADLPGADGVLGTADDVHHNVNTITPFVDQSQTYSSHPSHQVFLRDYVVGSDGKLHSTGTLLGHHAKGADGVLFTGDDVVQGMATWADVKANAAKFLGIKLTDADVGNIPLLATDQYGNFIPGLHGLPQLVVRNADGSTSLVEGNLATPISTANAVRIGTAFINDMAHSASPFSDQGVALAADLDTAAGGAPAAGFYDNELLDAHYIAGDGRVNENIGLTAVQTIFHSEHNRQIGLIEAMVQKELDDGNSSFAADWLLPGANLTAGHVIQANEWNGERLFQAAKFATETQYQHLVFEEFARMVDPAIHLFGGLNVHLNPAITSEFANVVYRFGHSMLDENINIYQIGADGTPMLDAAGRPIMTEMGLIQAFTNPLAFANDPNATADIVLGAVNQVGNEIDEFVTGSLRDNLLGLPLDLGTLNIARGRDTGVAPLNLVRNELFHETNDAQLRPYANWDDFGHYLKHPESLVNFVAAYGTHATVAGATTLAAKRAAADALVHGGTLGDAAFNLDAYNFMHSVGSYANNTHDTRAIHDAAGAEAAWSTGSVTGLDRVDMWIGGLAEKQNLFGSVLGSTFEFIFRTQLENLQDGDRLYYLPRIEGTHWATEIEGNSFAELITLNTGIKHLPGNIFRTPEYTVEASTYFRMNADGTMQLDAAGHPILVDLTGATWLHNPETGKLLVDVLPDGTIHFLGDDNFLGNTMVLGGTAGNDRLIAGEADDDAVWGDVGDDYLGGGGGADFVYGGEGNDTLLGDQGDDVLHGDGGNDSAMGGDGIDLIFGDAGDDTLDGGRGDDAINGGEGNDVLRGGEGIDELVGNEGDDWIEGGLGGDMLVGDGGAPTGQTPLYDGNDVLIGGPDGGDRMQGFNGDDIMLGIGSFDKFEGRLGFDWASYEQAHQGVDADLTRREFIAANGAVDTIRDFFVATEGVSGSAFGDILKGSDASKLLTTKDALTNVNLINGLPGFFVPGAKPRGEAAVQAGWPRQRMRSARRGVVGRPGTPSLAPR